MDLPKWYAIAITDEDGDDCYYKRYADGSESFVMPWQFPNTYKTEAAAKRQMNRIRRYLVPEYLETLRIATHPGWHIEQLRRARSR
jgi:hypothetical protein